MLRFTVCCSIVLGSWVVARVAAEPPVPATAPTTQVADPAFDERAEAARSAMAQMIDAMLKGDRQAVRQRLVAGDLPAAQADRLVNRYVDLWMADYALSEAIREHFGGSDVVAFREGLLEAARSTRAIAAGENIALYDDLGEEVDPALWGLMTEGKDGQWRMVVTPALIFYEFEVDERMPPSRAIELARKFAEFRRSRVGKVRDGAYEDEDAVWNEIYDAEIELEDRILDEEGLLDEEPQEPSE